MNAHQAEYRITTLCRVLEVSRSGYYAWLGREPSARVRANAVLLEKIQEIHSETDGTYGAPRMHMELSEGDTPASLNRVARVMKQAGIQEFNIRGFQVRDLRHRLSHVSGPQISRRVKRLRMHRLVKKVRGTYRYYPTRLGRRVIGAALRLREFCSLPALAAQPA